MPITNCRHFNGYKPCSLNQNCDEACAFLDIPKVSILIVHLGALGAVVRSTALLRAIKRKFPSSRITWVTDAPADKLLKPNPLIDRVFTSAAESLLEFSNLEFDVGYVIDKSLKASGITKMVRVDKLYGFKTDAASGAIMPATEAAKELWEIGLKDELKFFKNQKSELQLVHEALELGEYRGDEYFLPLSLVEQDLAKERRNLWQGAGDELVIGINTGCSPKGIPYKKLTTEFQHQLCKELVRQKLGRVVLLGGPEDSQRNQEIAQGLDVIQSPTEAGLRDGLISVAACDLVITGDSLGMHMAIALKKWVIAWFGPTCSHEIDLFGRGRKIWSKAGCGPCWKRLCQKSSMCYDQVSMSEILDAVREYPIARKNLSHTNSFHW